MSSPTSQAARTSTIGFVSLAVVHVRLMAMTSPHCGLAPIEKRMNHGSRGQWQTVCDRYTGLSEIKTFHPTKAHVLTCILCFMLSGQCKNHPKINCLGRAKKKNTACLIRHLMPASYGKNTCMNPYISLSLNQLQLQKNRAFTTHQQQ